MAQEKVSKLDKRIKRFNVTGLIHTLISVAMFVMSAINFVYQKEIFYYTLRGLSIATLVNSIIWLWCAIRLFIAAKQLNNPKSVKNTRVILSLSVIFVLTPDILAVLLYWLPVLKGFVLINLIGFISPVLVFIGWFVGKHLGKKLKKS
ncbi:MAG: hypothetical protein KBS35_02600 [Mycoplasma sp.]|nr:hypothetical protein [Candidatus Hennigella equi]